VGAGQIGVGFSENVTVKGKPQLKLSDGTFAHYASGSGTDTLIFTMTPGEPGVVVSVDLNGGAIIASEAGATLRMARLRSLAGKFTEKQTKTR